MRFIPTCLKPLDPAIVIAGFSSTMTQVLFLREALTLFYGNEIVIGSLLCGWLVWTGLGSLLGTRLRTSPQKTLALLFIGIACLLPLGFLGIRSIRIIFHITPGEIVGIGPMFFVMLALLALPCLFYGAIFPTACRRNAISSENPAARPYVSEAAGSAVGGIVLSLLLLPYSESATLLSSLSAAHLVLALFLWPRWKSLRIFLIPVLILLIPIAGKTLQRIGDQRLWPEGLVWSGHTSYGHAAFVRQKGHLSLYQDGLRSWTAPDPLFSEEAVHEALLQHPAPRKILLIGAGPEGAWVEVLKHPTVEKVFYPHPDSRLIANVFKLLPQELKWVCRDPRMVWVYEDGRSFLSRTKDRFDAILLNMSGPYTAQLNRFYSLEFFHLVRNRLHEDGIFALALSGSENVIGPELAEYLSVMRSTLCAVFPNVMVFPGGTVRMFASLQGNLTADVDTLSNRIKKRGLRTLYVQEYYLFERLSVERREELLRRLGTIPSRKINRDFYPIAYYFDAILWATYYAKATKKVYLAFRHLSPILPVLTWAVFLIFFALWKRNRTCGISLSILGVGFTEISLEYTLLLAFAILRGHLYPHVALLVGAYMTGLSIGAWISRSARQPFPPFLLIQAGMALLPLLIGSFILFCHRLGSISSPWITPSFVLLAWICGLLGGIQFSLAVRMFQFSKNHPLRYAGTLYAFDLFGSAVGALLTSGLFIPLFGIPVTLGLLFLINGGIFFFLILTR